MSVESAVSNPVEFERHFELGLYYVKEEDWSAAAGSLRAALVTDPNRRNRHAGKALALLGHTLLNMDDPLQATAVFTDACLATSRLPGLRSSRALALQHAGMVEMAIEAFEDSLQWDKHVIPVQFILGNLYVQVGKPDKAKSAYQKVLNLEPEHIGALTNLGILLMEADRMLEGVELLESACSADPRSQEAKLNLVRALGYSERWEEAIKQIGWLRRNYPDCPRTRVLGARILRCCQRGRAALPSLDGGAIDWGLLDGARNEMLGLIHEDEGNDEQAIIFFTDALVCDPEKARIYVHIAKHHRARKNMQEAIQAIDQAIEIDGERAESWFVRGLICFDMNQLDRADEAMQRTINLDPAADEPHYWIGRIRLRQDDCRAAAESLTNLERLKSPFANKFKLFTNWIG
jgi:tetratricopeptide (TPR) repeat protein